MDYCTTERPSRTSRAEIFLREIMKRDALVIASRDEDEQERRAISLGQLKRRGAFWSIVSPLNWSIEYLIREMPVPAACRRSSIPEMRPRRLTWA